MSSLAALTTLAAASGAPFGQNSILVSTGNQIREYQPNGTILQTIIVPYPVSPTPSSERVRDFVLTQSGQIAVFNGTYDPYLSVYDPGLNTWQHQTFPGWSTGSSARYTGIATTGPYIFVTDEQTFGDEGLDEIRGLIRFDTRDWSALRFETDVGTHDVTLGLDGLLYAIGVGSTDTRLIKVFDPNTLALVRTIDLAAPVEITGLAVNANGRIFGAGGIASGIGGLHEFSPSGELLRSVVTPADDCRDLDLAPDGRLIFASRLNGVWTTDESLAQFTRTATSFDPYVALPVAIPEPGTLGLIALGSLFALPGWKRPRPSQNH